jgi:hypothetical protein
METQPDKYVCPVCNARIRNRNNAINRHNKSFKHELEMLRKEKQKEIESFATDKSYYVENPLVL